MLFYNTGVFLYTLVIRISSLFKPKAKLWVDGRRNWQQKLQADVKKTEGKNRIWIHCASLGEFEQGRPLIEKIKEQFPEIKIILTFFSPSGYEIRKDYEYADIICYLPHDSKKNARDFIRISNPNTVIFVKYEFWLNYLFELKNKQIPAYLISAVFKTHQPFFKWYGKNFIEALKTYKTIFVQDEPSLKLLQSINITSGLVCGDTRIDRVVKIKDNTIPIPSLGKFSENSFILIAGSTWPKDEKILIPVFAQLKKQYKNLKLIIAPHETEGAHISEIENLLKNNNLNYSLYTDKTPNDNSEVFLINTIGLLSSAYRYGKIAYIGGGFDNGIHNTLEPAVYGLPIAFGPNYKKFNEAFELIKSGAAAEITNIKSLSDFIVKLLNNAGLLSDCSKGATNYILNNKGATEKIINEVFNTVK